jgi:hypothetical protein
VPESLAGSVGPGHSDALHPLVNVSCGKLLKMSSISIREDCLWNRLARPDCIHSVVECGLDVGGVEQGHGDVVERISGGRPALLQPHPQ